jgi:hypothetical protein
MNVWMRLLFATRSGTIAVIVFAAIALAAIAAPWIAPQNPYDLAALDLRDARLPPGSVGPSGHVFALGSDVLGRDVLAAILYGLRMSLAVGVTSSVIALAIGMLLGLYAAYKGGRIDSLLMRLVDLQLSFPTILVRENGARRGTDRSAQGLHRCRAHSQAARVAHRARASAAELLAAGERSCGSAGCARYFARGHDELPGRRPADHRAVARSADRFGLSVPVVRRLLDQCIPWRGLAVARWIAERRGGRIAGGDESAARIRARQAAAVVAGVGAERAGRRSGAHRRSGDAPAKCSDSSANRVRANRCSVVRSWG